MKLSLIVFYSFNILFWLLIVRIFLTWIPSIDWSKQPFSGLAALSDLFLSPFRKLIPPIGGLDWSPIIALLVLQFCQNAISTGLARIGY